MGISTALKRITKKHFRLRLAVNYWKRHVPRHLNAIRNPLLEEESVSIIVQACAHEMSKGRLEPTRR
jgi:hypothetical protein